MEKQLTIAHVDQENKDELKSWHHMLRSIFTHDSDAISFEKFLKVLHEDTNVHNHLLLLCLDDKPIGMCWVRFDLNLHDAYIPYTGLLEEYRSQGIYPQFLKWIEQELIEQTIDRVLIDCENPAKMKGEERKSLAERRLKFWDREGFYFVNAPYVRPPYVPYSKDYWTGIEDHCLLGFNYLKTEDKGGL